MPITTKYHFLSDLISTLEADGFVVGTGKQLQLQELLKKLPDDLPLESFKTLLCPLLAMNRQDQERFYELFDQSLRRVQAIEQPLEKTARAKRSLDVEMWRNLVLTLFVLLAGWAGYILDWSVFKWWGNPTFLLLVALAGGAIYFCFSAFPKAWQRIVYIGLLLVVVTGGQLVKQWTLPALHPKTEYVSFSVQPGSTITLPVPLENEPLVAITLCSGSAADTSSLLGSFFVDTVGNLTVVAKDSFNVDIKDTICVLAKYDYFKDTTYFVAKYTVPVKSEPEEEPEKPTIARLDTMPIPFPRDISELQIDPEQQAKAEFYKRNAWWLKLLIIMLFAAILWSIAQWRERKRRRLVAQVEQRDKAPYIWNVQSDQAEELIFSDSARIVFNQLRRRRLDDAFKLDVGKTVDATVRSAGRIDFQFKQQTSPPEYLLLLNRHGFGDHRAQVFDHLYHAFKANEVNVERFFYQGDPRLCFNEKHPNGINIKELQHRYGEARLFIIDNGYQLLNPSNGQLSKWATIFTSWRERALFTPRPINTWGRREDYLADIFYLMPASIESIGMTLDELSSHEPRSPQELIPKLEDIAWRAVEVDGDIVATLRKHYIEPMVQWIAACAVYPLLQWDITLFLGSELSPPNAESLLTLENLLYLTQLPWFIEGRIPDAAREELLDYLAQQGLEKRIRERLQWLMEHARKPNAESVAYDEYQINSTANEWRFTSDRGRRRELEEQLTRYYAAGHEMDAVVFKKLNQKRNRLDFEAPDPWKRVLFNRGDAFFGLRDWVWATPIGVLLSMVVLFFRPTYELCRGEKIPYQNMELCLSRSSDYLLYYEYLIRKEIAGQNLDAADSLLNYTRRYYFSESIVDSLATSNSTIIGTMKQVGVDTVPFLRNLSAYYYNAGVQYYNEWLEFNDSTKTILEQEQTLPQQQENEPAQADRLLKYQQWKMVSDSLAAKSCTNFRRGNRLFTNVSKGVGYDFLLAIQKTCQESPTSQTETPPEVKFQGTVTDGNGRPVAEVTVKALNGNVTTTTRKNGGYTLTLPGEMQDSTIRIDFAADGYAERTENLRLRDPLQTVTLEKLQPKTEGIEIFESRGMKGLRSTSGKTIVPARYNQIDLDPASGWYRVQIVSKLDIRMGYVNDKGKMMVPLEYRALGFLRDGYFLAAKDRYGYLDKNGNIAISFIYEGASDFNKGEAEVIQMLQGQRFTFIINKEGRCIRSCPPESAYIQQKNAPEQVKISENIEPIDLYFDLDAPSASKTASSTNSTYSELFASLFSKKEEYVRRSDMVQQNKLPVENREVDNFFSQKVQNGYDRFNDALEIINNYLQATNGQVEITLRGYAAVDGASSAYNQLLSARRIAAVKNSLQSFNNGILQKYMAAGRIKINEEVLGDRQADPKLKYGNANDPLAVLQESKVEVVVRFAN